MKVKINIPFFSIAIFLLVFFFSGCKKNDSYTTYDIPPLLKEYMSFKEGSYWIYKNEVTGTLDSCYVTGMVDFFFFDPGVKADPHNETIRIVFKSSFLQSCEVVTDHADLAFTSQGGTCLHASLLPATYFYDPSNAYYCFGLTDSVIVNNHEFFNVVSTQYSEKAFGIYNDTIILQFQLAKSIGLIKYRQQLDSFDTTWSLLRYHVVQ
jgi:hypothetical protein